MAGGIFTAYNKKRAGVYINIKGAAKADAGLGESGVAAVPVECGFGPDGVVTLESGADTLGIFGESLASEAMRPIREAMRGASKVLAMRLNGGGTKASGTLGVVTATAAYGGASGNRVKLRAEALVGGKYRVSTLYDNAVVDEQDVAAAGDLANNSWVTFSGAGVITEGSVSLAGGANTEVTAQSWSAFLAALESLRFGAMAVPVTEALAESVLPVVKAYVIRLRDTVGKKFAAVVPAYDGQEPMDHEAIVQVKNGVIMEDGAVVDNRIATCYVAGAYAAAGPARSLTFQEYSGAVDVTKNYTDTEIGELLTDGMFLFTLGDRVRIEQDVNSLTTYTAERPSYFRKARLIRTLDAIAQDFKDIFEREFVGKVQNNVDGRALFSARCADYLDTLAALGAIEAREDGDIEVALGSEPDSLIVAVAIRAVDAVEKIYMTVSVA